MVIWGMVNHCFTHMIYISSTALPALRFPSRETRSRDQQASRHRLGGVVLGTWCEDTDGDPGDFYGLVLEWFSASGKGNHVSLPP